MVVIHGLVSLDWISFPLPDERLPRDGLAIRQSPSRHIQLMKEKIAQFIIIFKCPVFLFFCFVLLCAPLAAPLSSSLYYIEVRNVRVCASHPSSDFSQL